MIDKILSVIGAVVVGVAIGVVLLLLVGAVTITVVAV